MLRSHFGSGAQTFVTRAERSIMLQIALALTLVTQSIAHTVLLFPPKPAHFAGNGSKVYHFNPQAANPLALVTPPRLDIETVTANWRIHTSCNVADVHTIYPDELEVGVASRWCHFATSRAFGVQDTSQIWHIPGAVNATRTLLDVYEMFGILSSVRGGSMLGLFRAGGHLKGDDNTGDHYMFYPNPGEVTMACVQDGISRAAYRHNCKFTAIEPWRDAFKGGDLECEGYTSHGTVYTAEHLLFDTEKT